MTAVPSRKVGAGGLAGALSVLVDVPPEVASAFTTVIGFGVGYFVSSDD